MILPSALTYKRAWKLPPKSQLWQVNPEWENAPYEFQFLVGIYDNSCVIKPNPIPIIFNRLTREWKSIPTDINLPLKGYPIRYTSEGKVVTPELVPI